MKTISLAGHPLWLTYDLWVGEDFVFGPGTAHLDSEVIVRMTIVDFGPLRKAFPELFARSDSGWVESVAVGAGWTELVWDLFGKLDSLSKQRVAEGHPPLRLSVVKEKYGALRVDLRDGFVPEAEDLIDEAEAVSETICEVCGQPGRLCTELRWMKALCPHHELESTLGDAWPV